MEPLLILYHCGSVAWERHRLLGLNGLTLQKRNYGISLSISAMMGENWDPKKQHRGIRKPKPLAVIITGFSWNWSHCKPIGFSPVGSLSWLTELVAHLWAGWGLRPSWCFPDVFSGMWEPQPTPTGSLAESHVHHIWTGIDWNSASDRGSRCKQPMSSQTGELGEMLLPDPFQIKKGYGKAHGFSGKKKKEKAFS